MKTFFLTNQECSCEGHSLTYFFPSISTFMTEEVRIYLAQDLDNSHAITFHLLLQEKESHSYLWLYFRNQFRC